MLNRERALKELKRYEKDNNFKLSEDTIILAMNAIKDPTSLGDLRYAEGMRDGYNISKREIAALKAEVTILKTFR